MDEIQKCVEMVGIIIVFYPLIKNLIHSLEKIVCFRKNGGFD